MQKVICILGMHRSGTSCLTGTLEEAGVYLGSVSRQNPFNLKGNHENSEIMALHEALLAFNQAAWDNPLDNIVWPPELKQQRDQIIAGYAGHACWGFKDPRSLLTLDGWLEALLHPQFAGIFRHPLAVANSLHHRNKFPLSRGLELWTFYNTKLLNYWNRFQFPILEFIEDVPTLKNKLSVLSDKLGLTITPEKMNFFDPALQNQKVTENNIDLPENTLAVLQKLREIAL